MSAIELDALSRVRLDWTRSTDEVWSPTPYHVDGLHADVAALLQKGINSAVGGEHPLGVVLQGERGAGKTHLLGWTRERVHKAGGYFFVASVLSGTTFWAEVLEAIRSGLDRHDQLFRLVTHLAELAQVTSGARDVASSPRPLTRSDLDEFATGLRKLDRSAGLSAQDTARALALLASPSMEQQDVGHYYFSGEEIDVEERRVWGIRSTRKDPQMIIGELTRLLAISGPILIAVDQIDALIEDIGRAVDFSAPESERLVVQVAGGLMALRDRTSRSLTVVSCLPESWDFIRRNTVDTVADRFRVIRPLQNVPTPDLGQAIIGRRLGVGYQASGYAPPYPTWPIKPAAFESATNYTVRRLLQAVEGHVDRCLRTGVVTELDRLGDPVDVHEPLPKEVSSDDLVTLDDCFEQLRLEANIEGALDKDLEDRAMPRFLGAGLEAWIRERGEDGHPYAQDAKQGKNPSLHASLRCIIDDRTERVQLWGFRAIASGNARAVQTRLRNAMTAVGLDGKTGNRHLFVLRNQDWPSGPETEKLTNEFVRNGGVARVVTDDDLRTFAALAVLLDDRPPGLDSWLLERKPASSTELFLKTFGGSTPRHRKPETAGSLETTESAGGPETVGATESAGTSEPEQIRIGSAHGESVNLPLKLLRRHTLIVAGAGSGKTVLLRRMVEECALQGVSSIVIDSNSDLTRLGDPWPESPVSWLPGDGQRADEYFDHVEVVVWTPGLEKGRPLTFQPLPAFADIRDDRDDFNGAVESAISALAPRVHVHGTTSKAGRERAILTEALRSFGMRSDGSVRDFVGFLADLPDDVSQLRDAVSIARELADRLQAALVNDPLFAGMGEPADPGTLITPSAGKRARVSVVNLVGIQSDEGRAAFVNQLQMALFSWAKAHPYEGPLGSLLVLDEAQTIAPATGQTAATQSTLMLAAQARKFGLGLIFATQAPKGLNNRIPGNATTQFYGLLSSHTQIEAARTLARMKGGDIPDIARLSAGTFYFATEGTRFRRTNIPMCLSHHPMSPLNQDEVVERARRTV